MKPTMDQAKKRYKSYTRGVLTTEFRKQCDTALWAMEDGYPVLQTDTTIHLHFRIDDGTVFAVVGKPANYKPGTYAGKAFGKGDR